MVTDAILQVKANGNTFYVMAHEDNAWGRFSPIDAKSNAPFSKNELRFVLHKMNNGELTDEFIGYISDIMPSVYYPRILAANSSTYKCLTPLCVVDIVYKFPVQCSLCRG